MSEKRNTSSSPVDVELLKRALQENDFSPSRLAARCGLGKSTIYRALEGVAIKQSTIREIAKALGIDYEDFLADATGHEFELSEGDDIHDFNEHVPSNGVPAVISFVSSKGGVGKTTLAISLAAELAKHVSVALVDADVFTMGATRLFHDAGILSPNSPSFVGIACSPDHGTLLRSHLTSLPPDNRAVDPSFSELLFVPAYVASGAPGALHTPPVVIDWSLDDATHATDVVISVLARMGVDVIVFDTHPGTMALSSALCARSTCIVLVSDAAKSTLTANWLFCWMLQSHTMRTCGQNQQDGASWYLALNKLSSVDISTAEYKQLIRKSWTEARIEWTEVGGTSNVTIPLQFNEALANRALVWADNLDFRRVLLHSLPPLAIVRLGGTGALIETRRLVRQLVSDGVLAQSLCHVGYADPRNTSAGAALDAFASLYNTPSAVDRVGQRRSTLAIGLLAFIVFFAAVLAIGVKKYVSASTYHAMAVSVSATSFSLLAYVMALFVRSLGMYARLVGCFTVASGLQSHSLLTVIRLFSEGVSTKGREVIDSRLVWLMSIVPSVALGAAMFSDCSVVGQVLVGVCGLATASAVMWPFEGVHRIPAIAIGALLCFCGQAIQWWPDRRDRDK